MYIKSLLPFYIVRERPSVKVNSPWIGLNELFRYLTVELNGSEIIQTYVQEQLYFVGLYIMGWLFDKVKHPNIILRRKYKYKKITHVRLKFLFVRQDTVVLWSKSSTLDREICGSSLGEGADFYVIVSFIQFSYFQTWREKARPYDETRRGGRAKDDAEERRHAP